MAKKTPEIDHSYFIDALKKMSLDIPIESACLPKKIEAILIKNEIYTVWDIINTDLKLVKGIGKKSLATITEHIGQFVSM